MTEGGPLNSTLSMALYAYNQFGFGNYATPRRAPSCCSSPSPR